MDFFLGFFFFAISITSFSAYAQDDFQEGYIVTNSNDTLYGKIRDRDDRGFNSGLYENIRFKGKGWKKRFSPEDIKSYKIGDKQYKTFFDERKKVFYRVESEGYLSHYVLEIQEQGESLVQDIDYVQKGENTPFIRANQGIFGIKKKRLASLLFDCPGLSQRIINKEFRYVFQIVAIYNSCNTTQQ